MSKVRPWFEIQPEETTVSILAGPGLDWISDEQPFHKSGLVHRAGMGRRLPAVDAVHVISMSGSDELLGHARVTFLPRSIATEKRAALAEQTLHGKHFASVLRSYKTKDRYALRDSGILIVDVISIVPAVRGYGVGLLFLDRIFRTWKDTGVLTIRVLPAQYTHEGDLPGARPVETSVAEEARARVTRHFLSHYRDAQIKPASDGAIWMFVPAASVPRRSRLTKRGFTGVDQA